MIFQTVEGPGVVKAQDLKNTSVPIMTVDDFETVKKPAKPAKPAKRARRKRAAKKSTTTSIEKE